MQCPLCGSDNIEGVDQCARCEVDLTDPDNLANRSRIEIDLMHRPLGELVAHDYASVAPDVSIREVARQLNEKGHHFAMVLEGSDIKGIFTERDMLNKVADRFGEYADKPVREFMTPDPEMLQFDAPVVFAINRMTVGGFRHVPVVKDDRLVGVVSVRDILAYMVEHFKEWVPAEATT